MLFVVWYALFWAVIQEHSEIHETKRNTKAIQIYGIQNSVGEKTQRRPDWKTLRTKKNKKLVRSPPIHVSRIWHELGGKYNNDILDFLIDWHPFIYRTLNGVIRHIFKPWLIDLGLNFFGGVGVRFGRNREYTLSKKQRSKKKLSRLCSGARWRVD